MMPSKRWQDYMHEGVPMDEWPVHIRGEYEEDMELTRQERYYRTHPEEEFSELEEEEVFEDD